MLLKIRLRQYANARVVKALVYEFGLAQNIHECPEYIEGDFVSCEPERFLANAKSLADRLGNCVEVVVPDTN